MTVARSSPCTIAGSVSSYRRRRSTTPSPGLRTRFRARPAGRTTPAIIFRRCAGNSHARGCASSRAGRPHLENATAIARALVQRYGEVGSELPIAHWEIEAKTPVSEHAHARLDQAVGKVLEAERARARQILSERRDLLLALRDLLLERKVLDRASFAHLVAKGAD